MDETLFELQINEKRRLAREAEKAGIRRLATALGFAYGGVLLISVGWYTLLAVILGIAGVPRTYLDNLVRDPVVSSFLQILLSIAFFILPFWLVMRWSGFERKELLPFSRPKKGTFLPLTLIGIGVAAFSNIANNISGAIFTSLGFPDKYVAPEFGDGIFAVILAFISTALIPAFVEEFGMRGVCLGSLRRYGDGFAIVVSSLLFGLIHGNFAQMAFAAIIGLAVGYAVIKSGSMWPAITIHFVNNFISVAVYYVGRWFGDLTANISYMFILCLNLMLGVLGVFLLARAGKNEFEVEENKTVATFKEKMIWFFTSPIIIICIVLTFAEAIFLR